MKGDIASLKPSNLNSSVLKPPALQSLAAWPSAFQLSKRSLDIVSALAGLFLAAAAAVFLLLLNPFFNPGPLLFKQQRMGMWGRPFTMWKFRSMTAAPEGAQRDPTSPLETDRITPLGHFIRRTRIDELPNFWSVLSGEMALVGPRPDVWDHATWFTHNVPYYKYRVRVRPGITGLAQIRGGYADEVITIHRKARYDYHYIRHGSAMMDLYIILRTVSVMIFGTGAK
ncbi:sugar transferase [Cribrihabitans pelagius]|uniref:sugar transferase n=1 Tax=Cribrihabitans pelagius TaxID=1765746 RepID=UPI003B5BFCD7